MFTGLVNPLPFRDIKLVKNIDCERRSQDLRGKMAPPESQTRDNNHQDR